MTAALRDLAHRTTVFAASGNHDLDGRDEEGEKVARWMRPLARDGVHVDYTSAVMGDDLVTVCPWWDGPRARGGPRRLPGADRGAPSPAVDLGPPRPARRLAARVGRPPGVG